MQSILSIHGGLGLPLCVSGITPRLDLSFQIVDHDLRREALKLKRQRSVIRELLPENSEMGSDEIEIISFIEGDSDFEEEGDLGFGDLNEFFSYDHTHCCTAKAA